MRALVTGVAGFIGSHLSERLLRDGHDVVGVDSLSDYYAPWIKQRNLETSRSNAKFRFVEGDLSEIDVAPLLEGVDYVYHLAARAGVRSSWGMTFDAYLRDNLLASQRLLEAAKGTGVKKIVYASSSSIYGDAEAYPTHETANPFPISPYGVSKLAVENLCNLYQSRFGVPAVSLRFFTVYGPRQRPDMAFHIFSRALLTGAPIEIYGDGGQSREFTYVGDIVDAVLLAGEKAAPGSVYNIGGGSEIGLNDAVALLKRLSGREVPVHFGAFKPGDAKRTAADISLARRDLGYNPVVGLEEGLAREIEWLEGLLAAERTAGVTSAS